MPYRHFGLFPLVFLIVIKFLQQSLSKKLSQKESYSHSHISSELLHGTLLRKVFQNFFVLFQYYHLSILMQFVYLLIAESEEHNPLVICFFGLVSGQ